VNLALDTLYKSAPLYQELFDKQLEFALCPNRLVAAVCSSRAGKTTVCGVFGIQELLAHPNSLGYYMALTKDSVRDIFLPTTRPLLEKYKIKHEITRDRIRLSNGSSLVITGADHPRVVETFRGLKLRFCIIDEAASFNQETLQYLIDEVIMLRLADLQGKLMLIGSPAAHCSGMFYDITNNLEPGWAVKEWGMADNPYMQAQFIEETKLFFLRKACDATNPKYRREYLGHWCADSDSLMMKPFTLQKPPKEYNCDEWRSVIGVDFGFNDKTAFTVIGWQYNNPTSYILTSFGKSGLGVTEIANILSSLKAKYRPVRIVGDPAGASKIMMQEFLDKHKIFMESAQKTDKAHYIEIMNDALVQRNLLLVPDDTDELQKEMKHVTWNEERTREREGVPCDHLDSALYAYREALAFTEKIPKVHIKTEQEIAMSWINQQIEADRARDDNKKGDSFFDDVAYVLED